MIPETAVIRSPKENLFYNRKVCGLYPLERLIIVLARGGVREIFLDLSPEELEFYRARISRTVSKEAAISEGAPKKLAKAHLLLTSNLFIQAHHMSDKEFAVRFKGKQRAVSPVSNEALFTLEREDDLRKAAGALRRQILATTAGYIARNINKRVSLPISLRLAQTRIHPNYLTVFNMLVGFSSGFFILIDQYWAILLGGFLFQAASVFDGVDGEVAKLTLKVSKIGGWLDTASDNGTLLIFLSATSYLYFAHTSGIAALAVIGLLFAGLGVMLAVMVRYLRAYTSSGSLVTYDKEFIQKLPAGDPVVAFVQRMKYITKKEFFSIAFFAISITGKIHFLVPIIATVLVLSALLLVYLDRKYDSLKKKV